MVEFLKVAITVKMNKPKALTETNTSFQPRRIKMYTHG